MRATARRASAEALVVWLGGLAFAQGTATGGATPELDAQTFRPSIDSATTLWVDDAGARPDRSFSLRLLGQYVDDPLVYQNFDGSVVSVVHTVWETDAMVGATLGPLRGGLRLPVIARTTSDTVDPASGLGDIGLDLKLGPVPRAPIGLALAGRVGLPTSTLDAALGSRSPTWELVGIVSRELGPVLLAANVGLRGMPDTALENVQVDDSVIARVAGRYAFDDRTGIAGELAGSALASSPGWNDAGHPLELLVSGYRWTSPNRGPQGSEWVIRGGAGTGLSPGIGAPDARVVIGVGWEPRDASPEDPDRDGILGSADGCPTDPEDADGEADEDGCPEPTSVLVLAVDAATNAPLDLARIDLNCGMLKVDGGRRIEAALPPGSCTVRASAAGYADVEATIQIPPGPPVERPVALPPLPGAKVRAAGEKLDLRDVIQFKTDSATILPASFGMLDEAVGVLQKYPEIARLRIEGHTDETGPVAYNLQLSRQRAAAVRDYLVGHGIDPGRLTSEGYGATRPVDPAHTAAAWEKNRRTEFFVEEWREGGR